MEPFLKSAGGKRWLAPQLVEEIMAISPALYVEPFVGGGAVTRALPVELPKLVSDGNPAIAAVWRVLATWDPERVFDELQKVEAKFPDTTLGYVKARDAFNAELMSDDRLRPEWHGRLAALALYINYRCYNGLTRMNSSGGFNAPCANYKPDDIRRFNLEEIIAIHRSLVCVKASHMDFRQQLDQVANYPFVGSNNTPSIAVYADPPYDGMYDQYTAEGFDDIDQQHLAEWLKYLSARGVKIWATNSDTPLIRGLYAWAKIEKIEEFHSVGAKGARRGRRPCLLIRG